MGAQGALVWPTAAEAPACTGCLASAYSNHIAGYQQQAQDVPCLPAVASYQQGAHAGPCYYAAPYAELQMQILCLTSRLMGMLATHLQVMIRMSSKRILPTPMIMIRIPSPTILHTTILPSIYNYPPYPAGYVQNVSFKYHGYQGAYGQNSLPRNPVPYAAHQCTKNSMPANGGAAADAPSMIQTSGGAATVVIAQAADPPSDGAFHPKSTGGAQMM